jgi:hypothetical protein
MTQNMLSGITYICCLLLCYSFTEDKPKSLNASENFDFISVTYFKILIPSIFLSNISWLNQVNVVTDLRKMDDENA